MDGSPSSGPGATGSDVPEVASCAGAELSPEVCGTEHWVVPSEDCPTLADAVSKAGDGVHIELLPGYREVLSTPIILDRAVFVVGPADRSAEILGEEGLIVAAGAARNSIVLRRLRLNMTGAPALLIAGGCTVEDCVISATGVGIEVAERGQEVRILRSVIRNCMVGISLAGTAARASLQGSRVEHCTRGVAVTGLDVEEGWSDILGSLAGACLSSNEEADLSLRGWSVRERASGCVRQAPAGEELCMSGWPQEETSVVAPTDKGPVVMLFSAGRVNATVFEGEDEYDGGPADTGSPREAIHVVSLSDSPGTVEEMASPSGSFLEAESEG